MDAVEEPVNWSAIACQAFEQKLADITRRRGARDMTEAINRLRASKRQRAEGRSKEGVEFGQKWAKDSAEVDQLERLSDFYDSCSRDSLGWEGRFDLPNTSCKYTAAERIAFVILGDDYDDDCGAASDFWELVAERENHLLDDFVRGFAEGALEVWHEVRDKL
jgi:hypothetical protein